MEKAHPLCKYEIHLYLNDKVLGITYTNERPEVNEEFTFAEQKLRIKQVYQHSQIHFILDMEKI